MKYPKGEVAIVNNNTIELLLVNFCTIEELFDITEGILNLISDPEFLKKIQLVRKMQS